MTIFFLPHFQQDFSRMVCLLGHKTHRMVQQLFKDLYAGQEATVRTGHGKQTGSKLGKEYVKAVYCHPAYLTYMQSTS